MAQTYFPTIDIQGDPFDCGKQYGNAAKQLIADNICIYKELIEFHANLSFADAIEQASRFIPYVSENHPDFMEEIKGIAEGSLTSVDEIMLLNARTELLSHTPSKECTSMSFLPFVCEDQTIWLAQNWDWYETTKGLSVILRIKQAGKPRIVTLVEAGQIGKIGFNDLGIGLCVNWLDSGVSGLGTPFILLCRAILNSRNIVDAINELYKCKRASSANFMLCHKDGFAIDFETTPYDIDFIEPKDGYIVHTNHFLSERLRKDDKGIANKGGDSLIRKQVAETIIRKNLENITISTIKDIQQNLVCTPYSVCTLPNQEDHKLDQWTTMSSIIMNLSKLELAITYGNPSIEPYSNITPFF